MSLGGPTRDVTASTGPSLPQATLQKEDKWCTCITLGIRRKKEEMHQGPVGGKGPSTAGRLKAALKWATGSGRRAAASPDVRNSRTSTSSSSGSSSVGGSSGADTPRYVRGGGVEGGVGLCICGGMPGSDPAGP